MTKATIHHCLKLDYCTPGIRDYFARHGLDFKDFVRNGLDLSVFEQINDYHAKKLVAYVKGEKQ